MRTKAEVRHSARRNTRLVDVAGAQLELGAKAERVVLAAPGAQRLQLDIHGEVAVPPVVADESCDTRGIRDEEILITIVVDVSDGDADPARRTNCRGQERRSIDEAAGAVVSKEIYVPASLRRRPGGADNEQVEPSVVVVVDKC